MKVIIAGAGLGGLCAGLALRKHGIEVEILEQAPQLGEVGAGIQISPNATRVMAWLGLEDELRKVALQPAAQVGFDWNSGEKLYRRPLAAAAAERYGAAYYQVHRADLHNVFSRAFGPDSLHLNTRVTSAVQDESGVRVETQDGTVHWGDILIGADGLKSVVREALGLSDTPLYTGITAYRGVIPAADLPADLVPRVSSNWMGPHGHVILYHLRNYELVNVVAVAEVDDWTEESWSLEVDRDEMLGRFDGWKEDLRSILRAIPRPFQWGLYVRTPNSIWGKDRITLLGDAAHPMVPFLAQGAAMALEDGAVLASCLAQDTTDPVRALRRYEDIRRDRSARVQLSATERGKTMHETDPEKIAKRNAAYKQGQSDPDRLFAEFDWLYRFDPMRVTG